MKTLIKNGRVVTAVDDYRADILIEGGTVSLIGSEITVEQPWFNILMKENDMKMNKIFLLLIIMIAAVSVSLGQAKGNKAASNSVRDQIEAASKGFAEALSKGQAAKIADMYAEGARVMPPNGSMVQERTKIQQFWQGFIDSGAKLSLRTSDVEAQGNVAIEVGTYEMIASDGKRDTGKFVVIWRRHKTGWKLAYDIWNSDL